MVEVLNFCLAAVVVPVLFLAPGYLIVRGATRSEGDELVLLSLAASITFAAMSAFAAYLSGLHFWVFDAAALLLVVALWLWQMARGRDLRFRGHVSLPWRPVVLYYVAAVCLQAAHPVYAGANWHGDWWMHYDIARFYLFRGPLDVAWFDGQTVTARTPFYNLGGTFVLSLLGAQMWVFQIYSTVVSSLFIVPMALLANESFGRRAMLVAMFLAMFNAALLTNVFYTWPKLETVFAVLASLYFYLDFRAGLLRGERRFDRLMAAVALIMLGYMTHQQAVYYAAGMLLDCVLCCLFVARTSLFALVRDAVQTNRIAGALLVLIAPWYAWAFSTYGVVGTLAAVPTLSESHVVDSWLGDRVLALVGTLTPIYQIDCLQHLFGQAPISGNRALSCWGAQPELYALGLRFFLDTLPGALSLSVSVMSIVLLVAAWRRGARLQPRALAASAAMPIAICVLSGLVLGHLALAYLQEAGVITHVLSIVPLLLVPAAGLFSRLDWRHLRVVLALGASEFVLVKGSHVWSLNFGTPGAVNLLNVQLKTAAGLVMVSDHLGDLRWPIVAVGIALLVWLYLELTRAIESLPARISTDRRGEAAPSPEGAVGTR